MKTMRMKIFQQWWGWYFNNENCDDDGGGGEDQNEGISTMMKVEDV